ncbi:MAG: lipopolysaccharide transport periplasmic protein LptA [Paracoccaceae bacterium]
MHLFFPAVIALFLIFQPASLIAQGADVAFGGLQHDASQPIEISADQLSIDQSDGSAQFVGNVLIGQGDLRLSAGKVLVQYAASANEATGNISRLMASGGVTLTSGSEAAEAESAEYSLETSVITMIGNVILTQGRNALSAQRMVIDLKTGRATMAGRVRTIFRTDNN